MKSPAIPYIRDETLYTSARSVVYRAHREDDGRSVILKALRAEPAPAEAVDRFRRECELTHSLKLPGVVGCYEIIAGEEQPVMVLEDFGGESLDNSAMGARLDLLTFLEIAYSSASALAGLHDRGIVHGNVSPSNIVFNTLSGQLKLIDLGCAIDLSHKGTMGTGHTWPSDELEISYASPEQIGPPAVQNGRRNNGKNASAHRSLHAAPTADFRSDLYSLGVTLYELLTGRMPFAAGGASGSQNSSPAPPHEIRGDIPAGLSEILLKLIEEDANRRYQTAAELVADLAATSMSEFAGESRRLRRESMRHEHAQIALQEAYDQAQAQEEDLREQQRELAAARAQIEMERQRYQDLFALAPDGYVVTDLQGAIREANQSAATMLGVDPRFARGLLLSRYVPTPEERQEFYAILRQLRESDATLEWDGRLAPRNGQPVDVVVRCSLVREGERAGMEARWLIRDVTARKRGEEALRISEQRFRMVAENGQDVTYRARLLPELVVDYISPSVTDLTGYTPEEFYAGPDVIYALLAHEDRQTVEALLSDPEKLLGSMVLRWRHKDGGVIWTEQRNAPMYDESGKVIGLTSVARDITARKLAEDALLEREYLIEKITTSSPHVIYILDLAKRRSVYTNRRFAELLGYPVEEDQVLGLEFVYKIIHPDDIAHAAAHMQSMATAPDNESSSIEVRVRDVHGEYHWIATRAVVFARNPDGTVSQILGTLEDVTQRKAVEEALRESEERFRTSVENMQDAFGIYSSIRDEAGKIIDFRIEYLNPVACRLNGMSLEEQVGHTQLEFIPPHLHSVLDKYRRVVETGEPLQADALAWEDVYGNEQLSLALDVRAVRLGDGYMATWRDVTDRKKREQLLLEREQFIEHIAEVTPGIIYLYDLVEGRVLYVNDQVKSITGFTPDQIVNLGTNVQSEFSYSDGTPDQDVLAERISQARDGEVIEFEYKVSHVDGSSYWILTRAVVFARDAKGAPRQMLAAAYDISDRKRIEDTVRQANKDLYARVGELSALNRISQPLTTITDLSSSMQTVCRTLLDIFKASTVSVSELSFADHETAVQKAMARASVPVSGDVSGPHTHSPGPRSGAKLTVLAHARNRHSGPDMTGHTFPLSDDPVSLSAVTEEQPVLIRNEENGVPDAESPGTESPRASSTEFSTRMVLTLRARGSVIGLLSIASDQEGTMWSPPDVRLAQTVAGMVASAIANTRLYTRELKQRLLAESLNEVGSVLTGSLDIDTVLHTIFEQLKRVLDYHGAALLLRDGDDLIETQAVGISAPSIGFRFSSATKGPQIEVFNSGEAHCISDTHNYRSWVPPNGNTQVRSWMGAPLIIGDRILGILTVSHTRRKTYTAEHLRLLQSFANEAAIAINNATRYQEAHNLAAFEERNRLARELHDSVTQSLFSANLVAKVLPDLAQQNPERFNHAVETLGQLTQTALAEMRTMLLELRPTSLTQAPLDSAFQNLAMTLTSRTPVETFHTSFDRTPTLPEDIQLGLYRIVQETLTNIIKHSQARHVEFYLRVQPPFNQSIPHLKPGYWKGEIAIHIADDGKGFDIEAVPHGHFGLQIMRERAASIGAKLELASEPGRGTQMTVTWAGETSGSEESAEYGMPTIE